MIAILLQGKTVELAPFPEYVVAAAWFAEHSCPVLASFLWRTDEELSPEDESALMREVETTSAVGPAAHVITKIRSVLRTELETVEFVGKPPPGKKWITTREGKQILIDIHKKGRAPAAVEPPGGRRPAQIEGRSQVSIDSEVARAAQSDMFRECGTIVAGIHLATQEIAYFPPLAHGSWPHKKAIAGRQELYRELAELRNAFFARLGVTQNEAEEIETMVSELDGVRAETEGMLSTTLGQALISDSYDRRVFAIRGWSKLVLDAYMWEDSFEWQSTTGEDIVLFRTVTGDAADAIIERLKSTKSVTIPVALSINPASLWMSNSGLADALADEARDSVVIRASQPTSQIVLHHLAFPEMLSEDRGMFVAAHPTGEISVPYGAVSVVKDDGAGWSAEQRTADVLRAYELSLRSASREHLTVVDPKSGRVVYSRWGEEASVAIGEEALRACPSGAIHTHNHPIARLEASLVDKNGQLTLPEEWIVEDNGFSPQDLIHACHHELSEVRASSQNFVFSMKPSIREIFSQRETDKLLEAGRRITKEVVTDFELAIVSGKMTRQEAQSRHWREIAAKVGDEMGWTYTEWPLGEEE